MHVSYCPFFDKYAKMDLTPRLRMTPADRTPFLNHVVRSNPPHGTIPANFATQTSVYIRPVSSHIHATRQHTILRINKAAQSVPFRLQSYSLYETRICGPPAAAAASSPSNCPRAGCCMRLAT